MARSGRLTFIFLLLSTLLCAPLSGRAELPSPRTIKVVMDSNYPPFTFIDDSGTLQGILVDQWRLWEKKSGIHAELRGLDWSDALRRMQAGEFDVIDTIFITASRQAVFDFSQPYQQIEVPIFFDKDIAGISDVASLKGFPVAVKSGDAAIELLKGNGIVHLIEYPSYEAIVRAAVEHKVNVFVIDKPPALYFLHKFGVAEEFRESKPLATGEFHRAVRKGNAALLRTVEQGFAAISPAEYAAINERWYGSKINGEGFQVRYLFPAIGAAGVVILLLLVSNRLLRKMVNNRTTELAASEERYRTLVDNIPLGITLISSDKRIVMVNRAQAELFGHPPEWFVGRLCHNEFEKRETACAHCPGEVSLKTGGTAMVETEGIRDDGSRINVQIHTVPLPGKGGQPEAFIEVVENITERRQAQLTIENERSRLRTLLHTIPELVWLKDPDGVFLACNPRFERLYGAREEDIIGKTDYDFVDRELADFFRKHDNKAVAAGGPSINEEWLTYADDGHRELVETIKTPMRDADGRLIGVLGVARDITAMRLGEQKIRQQAELLELARDSIIVRDMADRITYWNRGAEESYGWSREEAGGQVTHMLLMTEFPEPLTDVNGELLRNGAWEGELVHTSRDGRRITVASRWVLKRDEAGNPAHILEINNDITARRQAEEERDKAQKLESLGVLAGGIAHDFNNILTGILGNISFARMLVGEEHTAAKRLLECEKAAKRAGELTQQLLTFARGGEPVRTAVDARRLIEESISFALRGSNIKGSLECLPGTWRLDADPGQMSQVFNNLLINARQAMPQGGNVTVTAGNREVHSGDPVPVASGRYVRVTVTDQGSGIALEHLPRIFDPYFTTKELGSGLGLASLHSIIKRHGGAVSVSSSPGAGSTFTLFLPAAADQAADELSVQTDLSRLHGKGKILVMDDEELIRELAVALLEELGYSAETCSDGSRAVARHAASRDNGAPYTAIILDLTVPGGMGGREAAARIRAVDPEVPLIVSSGYSSDTQISECLALGFNGAVRKPYTMLEIAAELSRVIGDAP